MKTKIIVAALISVFFILTLTTALKTSGTCDEIAHHIPVGYALLTKWDFKMDTSQPPLPRYIIAWPLKLFMNINMPADKNEWRRPDRSSYGRDFFYKYNKDPKKMILLCRIPVILMGILCGLLLFAWASSMYGEKTGIMSLFLYSFSPNIIAHAGLATHDMAAALFIFLAVYTFRLFMTSPSIDRVFFAGASLGLAQLSKYNAILLYPVFLLLLILRLLPGPGNREAKSKLLKFPIVILISIIVIWAGYGFDLQPILKDAMRVSEKVGMLPQGFRETWLEHMLKNVPVPIGAHILGVIGVIRHTRESSATFFMGKWVNHGSWFYFLTAFLVKNPIPMLIFFFVGLYLTLRKKLTSYETVILVTTTAFFLVSLASNLQIGLRHLLPLFPFCFIIAGRSAELFSKRRILSTALWLLVFWNIFTCLGAWPNYLSYFNEFAGGSCNGYKILRDSNVDWGQDLPALAEYMKKNGLSEITLEYFGQAEPASYDIPYKTFDKDEYGTPKKKVYGVSVQYLEHVSWAKRYSPAATAGHSIFVYDFTK